MLNNSNSVEEPAVDTSRRDRILLAVAVLAAVALLALLLTGAVQDSIAPTLYRWLLRLRVWLAAVPASFLWILLVFAGVNIAIDTILRSRNRKTVFVDPEASFDARLDSYASMLKTYGNGSFYAWRIKREVAVIAMSTFGYPNRMTRQELQKYVTAHRSELGADVADFLHDGTVSQIFAEDNSRIGRITGELRARFVPVRESETIDPILEKTLGVLEAHLEIQNGS